ncbi:MAG: 3-keto-disaccharide hydrolase [Thermogutta sp.]
MTHQRMLPRTCSLLRLAVPLLAGWGLALIAGNHSRGESAADRPADQPPKKVLLTDEDLGAWQTPHGEWAAVGKAEMDSADPKRLAATPGQGVIYNGPNGRTVNLLSVLEHGDVIAHIEFMVPQGSNSGVYFQGRYEIQVLDSWGVEHPKYGDCGGIYQRWGSKGGFEGKSPRVNASRKPGEWQTFDVIFRAPRFDASGKKTENARFIKVLHNGVLIHENVEVTGPTRSAHFDDEKPVGPLMLQGDHGPVAYRNIWIQPTSLP